MSPWNGAVDTSEGHVSYTGVHQFEAFLGIRKQRPLYVIIWTREWAFLQGVCCGLSTCISCKTGIPELGHSAGERTLVVLHW